MNIILPIFFFAVILGLTVKRMTPALWCAVAVLTLVIIGRQFLKTDQLIADAKAAAVAAPQ